MAGFLFHDVIFGPVRSRRLGLSLGVNLLPSHSKYCSFNCIYCECGWTPENQAEKHAFPSRKTVREYLEYRLKELVEENYQPEAITYAGNGEPTMHPGFPGIVDDTLSLRDRFAPGAQVAVLSNASMIHKPGVFKALTKLDANIQKLDAGYEKLFLLINNPVFPIRYSEVTDNLKKFNGQVIIQSLFVRGNVNGQVIDNTLEEDVNAWLQQIKEINPKLVMIYPVSRATPGGNLEKVPIFELEKIADLVNNIGIKTKVYN
jgi:wyosine [tRNA(Phe)-imidazoG37] synthetase (radical SAM superfamily)